MLKRILARLDREVYRFLGPWSAGVFHKWIYQHRRDETWKNTYWLGAPVQKIPFDLWVQQEILFETKPDLLIETGTFDGGSALFYASLFDLMGHGEVVSVDIAPQDDLPIHPRVTYITASSSDPATVQRLRGLAEGKKVMVVLDSDHSQKHVRQELEDLAGLVSPGQYLIVEDTNVYGHPVNREHGPGPMEALEDWLKSNPPFENDPSREKYGVSFHPRGFWRRIAR